MQRYGVIRQEGFLVVFDRDRHKQVFKCINFKTLSDWIQENPGQYHIIDLVVTITPDDINYL